MNRAYGWTIGAALAVAVSFLSPTPAVAQVRATGLCDGAPAQSAACIAAIQAAGSVVNDVFKDTSGKTGPELPAFAKIFQHIPGCAATSFAGCAGRDTAPYDCPGQYTCDPGIANDFTNAGTYLNALDHTWWHPCRTSDHSAPAGTCPASTASKCVNNGEVGNFLPWEGLVFDLQGPANKVAIFAENDHGPQPCESVEYTVFLTDNPASLEIIDDPAAVGADPNKWNRAVLKQVFTGGWYSTRAPDPVGHATCGDTATYAVENDSFVTVYSMPCGINFRYTAITAGYDGKEFPECEYASNEGEIDAVAGLTEEGAGVCPDNDADGYVQCECPGHPPICDCNDADKDVHPGAAEVCDGDDKNCDGAAPECAEHEQCWKGICVSECKSGEFACPAGADCENVDAGRLCIPKDCTVGGCPPGSVCDPETKKCIPACEGVVCPHGQECRGGKCINPCDTIACAPPKVCVKGACTAPCNCFEGDKACAPTGEVCDRDGTNACVPAPCKGVVCDANKFCNDTGTCVGMCDGATCPPGQACSPEAGGCVEACTVLKCVAPLTCDPVVGACVNHSCDNKTCFGGAKCENGKCVGGSDGGGLGPGFGDASVEETPGEGGLADGGTPAGGGPAATIPDAGDDGSCGCRVTPKHTSRLAGALSILGLVALVLRRRRR